MWDSVKVIDSKNENVFKYVFEKGDAVAEAVLYKYPTFEARTVICCSTQSGCPVGCRFCGAGDSFVRSLTSEEIVAQVTHLFKDKNIDPSQVQRMQIMFMSMGEPLLNLKGLAPAIEELNRLYPQAALLVSTSGPRVDYMPFMELARNIDKVGLQFSVHESTDSARNKLVPFEAKLTLNEIAWYGVLFKHMTGRQPFFNYCAHEKNTSQDDVERIYRMYDPAVWQATISVVCERDEHVAAANERQRELAGDFMRKLMNKGYSTRMFDPAGQDDIGGGCGQLWFVQDWMKKHPDLAKPSKGRGLPIVHTPAAL